MKKNASSSTQMLIKDGGDLENRERNAKENSSLVGLNVPAYTEENGVQSGEFVPLTSAKPLENGNYLPGNFSVEAEQKVIPRSEPRVSCASTITPNTLFPGFQIPTETVIPAEESLAGAGKKKRGISAQEAIPILPRWAAITCLILNIIFPGLGTVISGVIAFFLTRHEMSLMNRTSVLCVNCFVGLMQLSTIVFLFIGWFWSIIWGCAFVGLSESYGKEVAKVEDESNA